MLLRLQCGAMTEPRSVEEWEASLPPCIECGKRMDALDHIEGGAVCVACELDALTDDDDEVA